MVPELLVEGLHEGADGSLGQEVEADRRLVQEEHLGPVEESRGDLHLHPLAEREAPHLNAEQILESEELDEFAQRPLVFRPAYLVDLPVQIEGLARRQVGPELAALPHDDGDPHPEVLLAQPGHVAHHESLARAGVHDAGEHLQRRGLARPIGAEEADHLALAHRERDSPDRLADELPASDEIVQRAGEPLGLLVIGEMTRQAPNFDYGHDEDRSLTRPERRGQEVISVHSKALAATYKSVNPYALINNVLIQCVLTINLR